jgi:hypothetical protein
MVARGVHNGCTAFGAAASDSGLKRELFRAGEEGPVEGGAAKSKFALVG